MSTDAEAGGLPEPETLPPVAVREGPEPAGGGTGTVIAAGTGSSVLATALAPRLAAAPDTSIITARPGVDGPPRSPATPPAVDGGWTLALPPVIYNGAAAPRTVDRTRTLTRAPAETEAGRWSALDPRPARDAGPGPGGPGAGASVQPGITSADGHGGSATATLEPAQPRDSRPRDTPVPAPADASLPPAVIVTTGLTKVFRSESGDGKGLKAVDRLDLSVRRGEIFGLLGPNGAGKTTTVGMLTTRVIPTSGQALVNGVDVVADPPRAKHFIGVVHQLNTLDRSLNAWENLYFHGRYYGMSAKASRQAADEQLERFRLSHRARSEVRTLSGGMARRLMVARALLHRPAVLFLDEPTASLDPQSRLALWGILNEIRNEGQTILLTTHYMEEAEEFCDRVAIMDHGRILALDTPARLKRSVGKSQAATSTVKAWLSRLRAEAHGEEEGLVESEEGLLDHDDVEAVLLEVVATADRLGFSLDEIRRGVTLETVFFNITGRDLRE